jgi:hypothetical protein
MEMVFPPLSAWAHFGRLARLTNAGKVFRKVRLEFIK